MSRRARRLAVGDFDIGPAHGFARRDIAPQRDPGGGALTRLAIEAHRRYSAAAR